MTNNSIKYNRLVLIGNGFDLALGLKTSYSSFILDYMKQVTSLSKYNKLSETDLFSIFIKKHKNLANETITILLNCPTMSDFLDVIDKDITIEITYKYDFFETLVKELGDSNWVDIEGAYYSKLEYHIFGEKHLPLSQMNFKSVINLNNCMEHIRTALTEYLIKEEGLHTISYLNSNLSGLIDRVFEPPRDSKEKLRVTGNILTDSPNHVTFLNFNYTNTLDKLLGNSFVEKNRIIPIHGSLSSIDYPPIFGYGDDTGKEYESLESLRNDDILKKIKSFEYSKAKHYHNLLDFIDSNIFDVYIIGHSCGLSDKTMLKSIFEHDNCRAIKNFHYNGKDENFSKGIAISRHFSDKALFRERLLPFDSTANIPQIKKNQNKTYFQTTL